MGYGYIMIDAMSITQPACAGLPTPLPSSGGGGFHAVCREWRWKAASRRRCGWRTFWCRWRHVQRLRLGMHAL